MSQMTKRKKLETPHMLSERTSAQMVICNEKQLWPLYHLDLSSKYCKGAILLLNALWILGVLSGFQYLKNPKTYGVLIAQHCCGLFCPVWEKSTFPNKAGFSRMENTFPMVFKHLKPTKTLSTHKAFDRGAAPLA